MIWKDVVGFEGLYQVSDFGLIKSMPHSFIRSCGRVKHIRENIKKSQKNHRGYERTQLTKDKTKTMVSVHRIVLFAFNPDKYFDGAEVNHKNGIKHDNRLENLEWCTKQENESHAIINGLKPRGETHHSAILNELSVRVIRDACNAGYKLQDIAKYFRVSIPTVSSIHTRRNWGWL